MITFTSTRHKPLLLWLTILLTACIGLGQDAASQPDHQATLKATNKTEELSSGMERSQTASEKIILNPKGGFLWKPTSSSDGKLVVLLPASFTGRTVVGSSTIFSDAACKIMHPLGDGRYAGVHNDNREHFRFTVPGDTFKSAVWFSVMLKDGRRVMYEIAQPKERSER